MNRKEVKAVGSKTGLWSGDSFVADAEELALAKKFYEKDLKNEGLDIVSTRALFKADKDR